MRALRDDLPKSFRPGKGLHFDCRELTEESCGIADAIITSPPFLGMRFDRPNWLRLWFCGWTEESFHKDSLDFLERQQSKDTGCYRDVFSTCRQLVKPSGILIVHVGSSDTDKLPQALVHAAQPNFELITTVTEDVESIEKHGLKDKGRTTAHNFLFLRPA